MHPADLLTQTIRSAVPDAEIHATDLGGGDHWFVVIVSDSFEGQRSFQRQRPVLAAFTPHIQSGVVHALDLKCLTRAELAEKGLPKPFVPHADGQGVHAHR